MTVEVRADLAAAHRQAWEHIARPGSWWTGAERVELVTTALAAFADPDPLAPWASASTTDRVPIAPLAPKQAHDAAYRIARHAGTMTESVYRTVTGVIGELPYVELCGVVSSAAAVAHFCRNVGIEVPHLPDPVPGDPSHRRPADIVTPQLNWVPVAAPADTTAAVVQAYSAVPDEYDNTWRLASVQYMPEDEMIHADWSRRPGGLSRPQMELVAAKVAQLRECFY